LSCGAAAKSLSCGAAAKNLIKNVVTVVLDLVLFNNKKILIIIIT